MSAKRAEKRRSQRAAEREERLRNMPPVKYVKFEDKRKKASLPNKKSTHQTPEEEIQERQEIAEKAVKAYHKMLTDILAKMSRISDPRAPEKIKHKMQVLLVYGILMAMYQIGSRRKANQVLSKAIFFDNLKTMFPELETMPHADTLARLLEKIEVEEIQNCMIELLKDFIRRKKFKNFLRKHRYIIAIDGSQKIRRSYEWSSECLSANVGKEKTPQYYCYVLEAVFVLDSGVVLPVMTEFIENSPQNKIRVVNQNLSTIKQDCERKGFYRMAAKLKKIFGASKVTIVADGLYACGPVISICKKYNWDYMITLKEGGLPGIWEESLALMDINNQNNLGCLWGNRKQKYFWSNEMEYSYIVGKVTKIVIVNVVICYESWEEVHPRSTKKVEQKESRYAWLSSKPLTENNVFYRCTNLARLRWQIEINFLVEKHQGYEFEHCYSYTWNAMKGFHFLMKIGHFMNVMALNSELLKDKVEEIGIRGFIKLLKLACEGTTLDKQGLCAARQEKFIHRLKISA